VNEGMRKAIRSKSMVQWIDDYIQAHPEKGYVSRSEFIREAVREKFRRIKQLESRKIELNEKRNE
jgi:Arc/MetJ-type ribon-helix-helix transcriptional regulator